MGPDPISPQSSHYPSLFYSSNLDALSPDYESQLKDYHIKGPEFVVRSLDPPRYVKLIDPGTKARVKRTVTVILLSGQKIDIECIPALTSIDDIFKVAIEKEHPSMAQFLGVAVLLNGEYHFPSPKTKIAKIAHKGFDATKLSKNVFIVDSFTVFIQFLHYPRFQDARHLLTDAMRELYLQQRHDLIEGHIYAPRSTLMGLSSLALQIELGPCPSKNEDYFLLEHYVPETLLMSSAATVLTSQLKSLHRSVKTSPQQSKIQFLNRLQGSLSYGVRLYKAINEKTKETVRLCVQSDGIKLLDDGNAFENLLTTKVITWDRIKKIEQASRKVIYFVRHPDKTRRIRLSFAGHRGACVAYLSKFLSRRYHAYLSTSPGGNRGAISKYSSEVNLHKPPLDFCETPIGADRQAIQDNNHNLQKTNLSRSCMDINESIPVPKKGARSFKRRLAAGFAAADFLSRSKDVTKDSAVIPVSNLPIFDETEELLENLENGVQQSEQENPPKGQVTYFPSEDTRDAGSVATAAGGTASVDTLDQEHDSSVFEETSSKKLDLQSSYGVKMGTRVTDAFNNRHKLNRSTDTISTCASSPPTCHRASVIDPDNTWYTPPEDETVTDSLVSRLMAAGVDSDTEGDDERMLTTISLTRENGCLGICLSQASDGAFYIQAVTPGGVADRQGSLRAGDRLVGVNGRSVENVTYEKAVGLLKGASSPLNLLVSQPVRSVLHTSSQASPSGMDPVPSNRHVTVINISSNQISTSVKRDFLKITSV